MSEAEIIAHIAGRLILYTYQLCLHAPKHLTLRVVGHSAGGQRVDGSEMPEAIQFSVAVSGNRARPKEKGGE